MYRIHLHKHFIDTHKHTNPFDPFYLLLFSRCLRSFYSFLIPQTKPTNNIKVLQLDIACVVDSFLCLCPMISFISFTLNMFSRGAKENAKQFADPKKEKYIM